MIVPTVLPMCLEHDTVAAGAAEAVAGIPTNSAPDAATAIVEMITFRKDIPILPRDWIHQFTCIVAIAVDFISASPACTTLTCAIITTQQEVHSSAANRT
ncbi:hypothetical protein AB0F52_46030 [Amycolatopsis sp. NPDC024027]|uniref:hypothetical protein n=1 Tax=Amycolatopsis sp. NPDC024027 TaxID=3154327 RepID=UPI0033E01035